MTSIITYYRTHRDWDRADRGLDPRPASTMTVNAEILARAEEAASEHELNERAAGFADACISQNTIGDLVDALSGAADATDCKTWGISAADWRRAIEHALHVMTAHVHDYRVDA